MEPVRILDGILYADMLRSGASNLNSHVKEINDLNVFPIPDGDTGDNMLLTMIGGTDALKEPEADLSAAARKAADGMLLSARGNSGVILSQIFNGIAKGFEGVSEADLFTMIKALKSGTKCAYSAVIEPVEGTILTVMREAADHAGECGARSIEELIDEFVKQARVTLDKTPDLLDVLKKAGVVDSGGAGLIYIAEGAKKALSGEAENAQLSFFTPASQDLDLDLFTADSELEFGYCTECLIRLQNSKVNPASFDENVIIDYLQTIGDSVVSVKTGSIVKIHVHTKTPGAVLDYCQKFGEFLKIKIENMSLQHNNTLHAEEDTFKKKKVIQEHKPYGIVAVANGEGIAQAFLERGVDKIVDGGQSMNPSAEDFLEAFKEVSADTIFVFPNNSNIILTAKQAASLYSKADIRVIESKTIGEGYSALLMYDTSSGDTQQILEGIDQSMEGVVTAEVSRSIRDSAGHAVEVHEGDYIGFVGDDIISSDKDRLAAACALADRLDMRSHDICLMFYGKEANGEECAQLEEHIKGLNPNMEIYSSSGMQEIYDYIIILE